MNRKILASLLITLAVSDAALAANEAFQNAFSDIPSRFTSRNLSVGSRALGEVCLSRSLMPDQTVCNPSRLGEVSSGELVGQFYIGNGYEAFSTANQLIFQPLDRQFLEGLFKRSNTTGLEFNAGLTYTMKNFSASFQPYRLQYLSEIHNPNYPVLAVHASLERSLTFSAGSSLSMFSKQLSEVSVGTNVRLLQRNFVHGAFSLPQAVTDNPRGLLPAHAQRAVLLDPVLSWTPKRIRYSPIFSFGAKNLGWTWPRYDFYPERTDLVAGVGIEPTVGYGKLRLSLDMIDLIHAQTLPSRVRFGSSYQIGMIEAMTGVNSKAFTAGMQFAIEPFQGGIVYEFVRADVEGALPENRIATEFAVRL